MEALYIPQHLIDTWQRAYSLGTKPEQTERLKELLTWDKPRNNNKLEHEAKICALKNLLSK